MSKAEERALEKFPVHEGASEEWIKMHLKGVCAEYIEGYHQAEKDFELNWRDIKAIDQLLWDLCGEYSAKNDDEGYFKEVLKRLKEMKKK